MGGLAWPFFVPSNVRIIRISALRKQQVGIAKDGAKHGMYMYVHG